MAAQDPLQLDFVAVSGANQYNVNPFALVSTVTPLIFLVFRAVLDELTLGDETALTEEPAMPADPVVLAVPVLPQAAAISAMAARPPGTHHRLRITYPPLHALVSGKITHLPSARNAHRARRSPANRECA
jgi:hypothetical protein